MNSIKKDYLISNGINSLLKNRFKMNINQKVHDEIIQIENEFNEDMRVLVEKENDKYEFKIYLEKDILKEANEMLKESENPLIVYDDVYGIKGDVVISSTRLTNPESLESIIGERPGSINLDLQRSLVRKKFQGKTVDIYDIGIFEGETLKEEIIEKLPSEGINIGKVFINIGNKSAVEKLRNYAEIIVAREYDFGEWIENRDNFLLDGRKVLRNGSFEKSLPSDHLIIPYTCNPEWSSISEKNFGEYKNLCQRYGNKLINILREANHKIEKEILYSDDKGVYVEKLSLR
ncbi:MAG: hypothetical protein KC550_03705 [Nanoarchaeota archaeon]|nr:hypothetical protein [Nanoarchaeota archaeon]